MMSQNVILRGVESDHGTRKIRCVPAEKQREVMQVEEIQRKSAGEADHEGGVWGAGSGWRDAQKRKLQGRGQAEGSGHAFEVFAQGRKGDGRCKRKSGDQACAGKQRAGGGAVDAAKYGTGQHSCR